MGEAFPLFDLWDQAELTDTINRPLPGRSPLALEDQAMLGPTIAPLKSFTGEAAKIRFREIKPFGMGSFRAPEASPRLVTFGVKWSEELVELVLQDERHRITPTS